MDRSGEQKKQAEVTFRDFRSLAERRGCTVEFLAGEFRGKIEEPSEFFTRVLSSNHYKGYDLGRVVMHWEEVK